jgi:predicted nucleotidyltransferase component of viral defense system
MSPDRKPTNVAASVRARLLNLSRQRGEEFQLVLSDFATERLLYRLGVSPYSDRYILKGAMLFRLWSADRYRATWDLDLLGHGASSIEAVTTVIRDLCTISTDDGIAFDLKSIAGEEIRIQGEYAGVRVKLLGHLADARIPMQIDIGFGDAVFPVPHRETYPTLLDLEPPQVLAYPREAVVAEKLEAVVTLGVTNSRMKDFYDLHQLATHFHFEGQSLTTAIQATFSRRKTPIPGPGLQELSTAFLATPARSALWVAFWKRSRVAGKAESIEEMSGILQSFFNPLLVAMQDGQTFSTRWQPKGPWR